RLFPGGADDNDCRYFHAAHHTSTRCCRLTTRSIRRTFKLRTFATKPRVYSADSRENSRATDATVERSLASAALQQLPFTVAFRSAHVVLRAAQSPRQAGLP